MVGYLAGTDATGSSPRVRGTLELRYQHQSSGGIIPACAGNTRPDHGRRRPDGDHPRVCGEHRERRRRHGEAQGSSPRVRGTHKRVPSTPLARNPPGIIPACAGNTANALADRWGLRDHPRVCGEHCACHRYAGIRNGIIPACAGNTSWSRNCSAMNRGSSPRVRGTRHHGIRRHTRPGIIPACAGNTPAGTPTSSRSRDHPRVCGEHMFSDVRR